MSTASMLRLVLAALLFWAPAAFALDPPHDISEIPQVCFRCHMLHRGTGTLLSDPVGVNNLCEGCHYDGGPGAGSSNRGWVHTHAGTKEGLPRECSDCHDPHTQRSFIGVDGDLARGLGGQFIAENVLGDDGVWRSVTQQPGDIQRYAPGDGTGLCEVCHTTTSHFQNGTGADVLEVDKPSNEQHNLGADCSDCHFHFDPEPDGYGWYPRAGGDDCMSCHAGVVGDRRRLDNDFSSTASHHVARIGSDVAQLNQWDCIICHLEGDAETGGFDSAFHNNGDDIVHLRNVDDPTETTWTLAHDDTVDNGPNTSVDCDNPNDRTELTMFCLACHDSNGIGDSTLLSRLGADTAVGRGSLSPFGGDAPIDVNSQFDPGNSATHSISCYFQDASGGGCGLECIDDPGYGAGYHNDQATGDCVLDDTCTPGTCPGQSLCSESHGEASCTCPLPFTGADCNLCAPGFDGGAGYPDCVPETCTQSGSCANGHGTCVESGGTPAVLEEQITLSDAAFGGSGTGWTNPTDTSANGGSALRSPSGTSTYSFSITTWASSLTHDVWVAARSDSKRPQDRASLEVRVGGQSIGTLALTQAYQWAAGAPITLSAGPHTVELICTSSVAPCDVDGLLITSDGTDPTSAAGFTPYTSAVWDATALDFYIDNPVVPPGWDCVCATGYAEPDCDSCASGYHQEGGQCVPDGGGVCASVTCDDSVGSPLGTCFEYTSPTNTQSTIALCDCPERYGGSTEDVCDFCSVPPSGTWTSGQVTVTTPNWRCGAWAGWDCASGTSTDLPTGWNELRQTECADCHLPSGDHSQPFSNNAHGSADVSWLGESDVGADEPIILTAVAGSNAVCFKCHNYDAYSPNGANQDVYGRYNQHDQGSHFKETSKGSGQDLNIFNIGCLNCHGGGGYGSIHGTSAPVWDDDSQQFYDSVLFVDGAALDRWDLSGSTVTCSTTSGTTTYNIGCTQHGSQSYTRNY